MLANYLIFNNIKNKMQLFQVLTFCKQESYHTNSIELVGEGPGRWHTICSMKGLKKREQFFGRGKTEMDIAKKHQMRIARQTLKMTPAFARISRRDY